MGLWLARDPLILASKSEVRRAILEAAGIPVEVCPAEIDERRLEEAATGAGAGEVAALLAREKARAVAAEWPGRLVVGADQVLALGSQRFAKPGDRDAARAQLRRLRGQAHELHSAVAVFRGNALLHEYADMARLTMRAFSDGFLERYLDAAGSAVTDSVGGYQLERMGIHLFEKIEGDHFTILGLPLLPLLSFLRHESYLE